MRQSIVTFAGQDGVGGDLFDVSLDIPDAPRGDVEPTPNQSFAIEGFYETPSTLELTEGQAHTLLCYRDFAIATVERLEPQLCGRVAKIVATFVAAFIAQDEQLGVSVVRYMDRRFNAGADIDELPGTISRTNRFSEVRAFLADALADMRDAGADL